MTLCGNEFVTSFQVRVALAHDVVRGGVVAREVDDERVEQDQRRLFEQRPAELTAVLAGTATVMSAIAQGAFTAPGPDHSFSSIGSGSAAWSTNSSFRDSGLCLHLRA